MKGQERRRQERYVISMEGTFGSNGIFFSDLIKNISLGGMCITSPKELKPDTVLNIVIPSKPPLKIKGRVVWNKKEGFNYNLGIEFITKSEEQNAAVRQIINSFFWEKHSQM